MPILVTAGALPPPPPPSAPPVFGFAAATLIEYDGTEWPLTRSDVGYFMTDGITGIDAADVTIQRTAYARGGSLVDDIRVEERQITLPLYAWGLDHTDFLANWRGIGGALWRSQIRGLDGKLRPFLLRFDRPDGTGRQISAHLLDGFAGTTGVQHRWDTATPTLLCPDGLFTDVNQLKIELDHQAAGNSFRNPFLSIKSSSDLSGPVTLVNPGDDWAWPEWTVTGPMSLLLAEHLDTGQSFQLDPTAMGGALAGGDQVTISTNPWRIRGPDGTTPWTKALNLKSGGVLWGLAPGPNNVQFTVTGAGTGTQVRLAFYPRYRSS